MGEGSDLRRDSVSEMDHVIRIKLAHAASYETRSHLEELLVGISLTIREAEGGKPLKFGIRIL